MPPQNSEIPLTYANRSGNCGCHRYGHSTPADPAGLSQSALENEPTVTALLEKNPFADKAPLYVRAQFYDYTFADSEQKTAGQWWNRRLLGQYFPQVHLKVRPAQ